MAVAAIWSGMLWASGPTPSSEMLRLSSNYHAYPYPQSPMPVLSAAPEGYVPFHMEHYGRHGSRWHIGEGVYRQPIDLLRSAERNGKLTPRGVELMQQLRATEKQSRGRYGELTPLGARQHRGIAQRMTRNFPEIFNGNATVDARSTQVIRCILSMDNELQELKAYNPGLRVSSDASAATMPYMNFDDSTANALAKSPKARRQLKDYKKNLAPDLSYIHLLVSDPVFAADSVNALELGKSLYLVAANSQSLEEQTPLWDLFTEETMRPYAYQKDADWFLKYGYNDVTDGAGPMRARHLLRNILQSADTAICYGRPSANLRFGHDVVVVPLMVLMNIDSLGTKVNDFAELPGFWELGTLTPMAANVQMIFYRPVSAGSFSAEDVLVKVLLNEHEATLPLAAVSGPYYRWSDVRKYLYDRMAGGDVLKTDDQDY